MTLTHLERKFLAILKSLYGAIEEYEIALAEHKAASISGDILGKETLLEEAKERAQKMHKQLRADRKLFVTRNPKMSMKAKIRRDTWLGRLSLLEQAMTYKDAVYEIWRTAKSADEARRRFAEWKQALPPELEFVFGGWIQTVGNWDQEIFAWFEEPDRVTNGYTESMVGKIKRWNKGGRFVPLPMLSKMFRVLGILISRSQNEAKIPEKNDDPQPTAENSEIRQEEAALLSPVKLMPEPPVDKAEERKAPEAEDSPEVQMTLFDLGAAEDVA